MCQQAMIVIDCTEEVRLPPSVVAGDSSRLRVIRRDPVSADLEKIPVGALKLKSVEQQMNRESSAAACIKAVKRLGYLTIGVMHAQKFVTGEVSFPEEWKGSPGNRWYIGILADEIGPVASSGALPEPMIMVMWWDWTDKKMKWSYSAFVSDGRSSKFFVAVFDGCALTASRKMRLEMEARAKK